MDDKELALASLVLLGVTIESHTDIGLSTPLFYDALSGAIEIAQELGIDELTIRLQSLQIEVGEMNITLAEKAKQLAEQFGNLDEVLERLSSEGN
jgi:xanthine dehydrogenase iron-sulfur cluster and FAD-binding subunit A